MPEQAFQPNWASPIGETLTRLMEKLRIAPLDLAQRLGITLGQLRALAAGILPVSTEVAQALSSILGGSPSFWINRDGAFRANVSKMPLDRRYDREWVKSFPVRELAKLGWIQTGATEAESAAQLLHFFGIQLSSQWKFRYPDVTSASAFRTSAAHNLKRESISSWVRQGERIAQKMDCEAWNRNKFRLRLNEARKLTFIRHPQRFFPQLQKLCAECGVALVAVPTPPGCPASGATQFLTRSKALLMLSFRFKTDDQFWFSFFHEAGHLLLHEIDEVFVEDELNREESQEEQEANEFAQKTLVPFQQRDSMLRLGTRVEEIVRFAIRLGIAPGIVVGQLQKSGVVGHDALNRLKRRYKESDIAAIFSL